MISSLHSLDTSLFLFLNSFHVEWLNQTMVFFSGQLVWTPLILAAVWRAKKLGLPQGPWIFALFLLLALVASDVTSSYITKNIVNRMRPCRLPELLPYIYQFGQKCGGKFGFVSSHAANSFALVTYLLFGVREKKKVWHLLWAMPIMVSYSRIYLGVHYPGDILGGALIGVFWGLAMAWIFRNSREQL